MIAIAAIQYANIQKGPIEEVRTGIVDVIGDSYYQSRAWLRESWLPACVRGRQWIHGVGTHQVETISRYMAISESIERLAFFTSKQAGHTDYGFDYDFTTNGMAAYPGLTSIPARRSAYGEAIERYCLHAWWDGLLDHSDLNILFDGDVQGIEIHPPDGVEETVVVLYRDHAQGFRTYGFAASASLDRAIERALIELLRTEQLHVNYIAEYGDLACELDRANLIERRARQFALPEGVAKFEARCEQSVRRPYREHPKTLFSGEIKGPWSRYARVWRVVLEHHSPDYLASDKEIFFW